MRQAIISLSKVIKNLKRPPKLSLSDWSKENRILSSEESSIPGKWNPDFMPFQKGIMDSITDPLVEKVVLMCSTRIGKTFIATCAIGYYSDLDPAPMLVVKPRGEDCNSFSKQELFWLFNNTPVLNTKLDANEGKTSTNTLNFKQLTSGGSIRLVGSNSPSGLSGYSARIIIQDEIDKYEPIVGFGNPSELAEGRASTFPHNKKIIYLSSPTIEHTEHSKLKTIHSLFLESSQAYFNIPCPSCGKFQPIEWDNVMYSHCKETLDDVYIQCQNCNYHINESQKKIAIRSGKWIDTYPNNPIKGYNVSQLYSPFTTLEDICREWITIDKSNNIYSIQRFKNEVLGLPFHEDFGLYKDSSSVLYNRRETLNLIPVNAYLLTMAVDTQDSWLSYTVTAWGIGRECFVIESGEIAGDPATPGPWEELHKVIKKKYKHAYNIEMIISKVFIDTQGHKTTHVNNFLKGKGPIVQGIFGAKQTGKPIISRSKRDQHTGLRKWEIGTEDAKTDIFSMLSVENPGENYIHFSKTLTEPYFKQLFSERKINGKFKQIGQRRNEKLDELVYNFAAYYACIKEYSMEQRKEILLNNVKLLNNTEIIEDVELEEEEQEVLTTITKIPDKVEEQIKVEEKEEVKIEEKIEDTKLLSAKERYLLKFKNNTPQYNNSFWDDSIKL